MSRRARGQANLPALAVALLALTATAAVSFAVADGAFASADRESEERYVAVALSERLVDPDGPLAVRRNVLNRSRVASLSGGALVRSYPVASDHDVRVRLDERTLVDRGSPAAGSTVRRIVLVADRQRATWQPPLPGNAVTIPRRTSTVNLSVDPPGDTTVRAVRANDRIVLRNETEGGLRGNFTVNVSRFETVRFEFEADRPLPRGSVTVTYYPERTTKATLEVTVDARD